MSAGDSDNDSDNDTGPLRAAFTSSAPLLQYGFVVGFLLGGYAAGQRGALQFLAEHQHELPRTRAQGLAFHRNKNYRMMAAFVSGGMRRGTQLALVAATYSATRIALEHGLQRRPSSLLSPHVVDTVCGALVGSVLFALSSPRHRAHHFRRGLALGAGLGGLLSTVKFLKVQLDRQVA